MSKFEVRGGTPLKGEITPQGAKNEALQIICATLLTAERVVVRNIPDIADIRQLIGLMKNLGVKVEQLNRSDYAFTAENIDLEYLKSEQFKTDAARLRGSVMMVGPLTARFGEAYIPKPGGDKIGRRRLDTHFIGLQKLGAKFNYDPNDGFYSIEAKNLKGCALVLGIVHRAFLHYPMPYSSY